MRKDFLTTKYYYKTKPDGSKRQLYHDSFFSPVYFLLLCKPLTPKISFVILLVKFPHSPILHYAFSSWIEKTTTKTIHCFGKTERNFTHSPYCLPYRSFYVSLENLVLDQVILIP